MVACGRSVGTAEWGEGGRAAVAGRRRKKWWAEGKIVKRLGRLVRRVGFTLWAVGKPLKAVRGHDLIS